jgi:multiple sugar transport system permease protein
VSGGAIARPPRGHAPRRVSPVVGMVALYATLVVLLVIFLFPFYWMAATSIQTAEGLFSGVHLIPNTFTLDHYRAVLASDFLSVNVRNSLLIAAGTTLLTTSLALASAYSFLRYRYRGRTLFSRLVVLVYLFPTVLVLVPMYFVVSRAGLLNSPLALIAIHTVLALPFCVWMLQSFLEGVPREPEEAALVFGASRFTAFRVATVPLATPGILAAGAFAFILSWGEYLFAFVLNPDPSRKTAPVALKDLFSSYAVDWGVVTAAGVVATIPVLLLFWLMAKYLAVGIARGAFE